MKKLTLSLIALVAIGCTSESHEASKTPEYETLTVHTNFYELIRNGSTMAAEMQDNTFIVDRNNLRVTIIDKDGETEVLPMYCADPIRVTSDEVNEAGTKNYLVQVRDVNSSVRIMPLNPEEYSTSNHGIKIFSNK